MLSMPSDHEAASRWVNDILNHIVMASGFVDGTVYDDFKNDNLWLYEVIRCLEIVSEASRRLPVELKSRHKSISWREMAGASNIYRHEYEDVVASRVWRTLTMSLPVLRVVIEQELANLRDP